jgi:hypothetical protein
MALTLVRIVRDATSTAYVLADGRHVCTARGCRPLRGRALGWLDPGPVVPELPEPEG